MTTAKIEWLLPSVPESLLMLDDPPQGLRPKWLAPGAAGDVLKIDDLGRLAWGSNPSTLPPTATADPGDVLTIVGGEPVWMPLPVAPDSLTWPLLAPDGTVAAPSYSFAAAPTTGIAYNLMAAGDLGFVVDGVPVMAMIGGTPSIVSIDANLYAGRVFVPDGTEDAPGYAFAAAPGTGLVRNLSVGNLSLAVNGKAYTSLFGYGPFGILALNDTHLTFVPGNAKDIGAPGAEPRSIYVGTNLILKGAPLTNGDGVIAIKIGIQPSNMVGAISIGASGQTGGLAGLRVIAEHGGSFLAGPTGADAMGVFISSPTGGGIFSIAAADWGGTYLGSSAGFVAVNVQGITSWVWDVGGTFRPWANNAYDIGAASAAVRDLYLAGKVYVNGVSLNPMTAVGDLIRGNTAGAPARLGIGTAGQVLTVASGVPAWAAPTVAGSGAAVPPTIGTISTASSNDLNVTPLTVSHTTGVGETYLLVKVGVLNFNAPGHLTSVTFGATPLTKIHEFTSLKTTAEIWGGVVPASTTATVTASGTGYDGGRSTMAVVSYKGVASVGTPKHLSVVNPTTSSSLTFDEVGPHILATDVRAGSNADPAGTPSGTLEYGPLTDGLSVSRSVGSTKVNTSTLAWTGLIPANGHSVQVGVPLIGTLLPGGISFPILAPDGSLAAPSYSFLSDPASGFYRGMAGGTSFAGHLFPGSDGLLDVGALSRRLRSLYALTSVAVGGGTGYITLDHQDAAVARIRSDKVILITQDGMGLQGLKLNWGTVQSHYNLVLGTETYPDTGTGILFLSEPVAAITTPATGLVALYGQDYAAAGTKGLTIRTEDGFIHRIGKGHQYPALSALPATPPAGFVVVYAKSSDKKVYQKDDAGLETILTANNPMTAVGDLIYGGAAGVPTRLAAVAIGAVLASAGVTTAPTWSTTPTLATLTLTARLVQARVTVTYSASMTLDASLASQFVITATNATAFTINAPTNAVLGQEIFVRIRNTSGGALGTATWNAIFKLATWTQPANGFSRTIHFMYDGTNWVETTRTTVDVAN